MKLLIGDKQYGGPFLFGDFSIADAMFAPVAMRFNTWKPALSETAAAYARRVTELPAVRAWVEEAQREPHVTPAYDTCT